MPVRNTNSRDRDRQGENVCACLWTELHSPTEPLSSAPFFDDVFQEWLLWEVRRACSVVPQCFSQNICELFRSKSKNHRVADDQQRRRHNAGRNQLSHGGIVARYVTLNKVHLLGG